MQGERAFPTAIGTVFAAVAVLLICAIAAPVVAGAEAPGTTLSGTYAVPAEGILVRAGETLTVAPGAEITGPGSIIVEGTLVAEGTAGAPITIRTPVTNRANGVSTLRHAQFAGIPSVALAVVDGRVILDHVSFTALKAAPPNYRSPVGITQTGGTIEGQDIRFTAPSGDPATGALGTGVAVYGGHLRLAEAEFRGGQHAIRLTGVSPEGPIQAEIAWARLADQSAEAVLVEGAVQLVLADSQILNGNEAVSMNLAAAPSEARLERVTLLNNARNLQVYQQVESSGLSKIELVDSALGPLSTRPGLNPAFDGMVGASVALFGVPRPADAPKDLVRLEGNTISGATVGVFHSATGIAVESLNNTYRGNVVGFQSDSSNAVLSGDTFESLRYDFVLLGPANTLTLTNEKFDTAKLYIEGAGVIETDSGTFTRAALIAAAAGGAGLTLLGALVVFSHTVRDAAIRMLFLPLYARLSPHEVLSHDKRKDIVGYIEQNPGAHLRAIGRELNLTYGTLTYHLYRLEKEGIVVTTEDGLFKRFYLSAGRKRAAAAEEKPSVEMLRQGEREIYQDILAHPGSPQSEVAERLGLSRQALHYHIKRLAAKGLITKVTQGRETLCYANPDVLPLGKGDEGTEAAS